MKTKLQNFKIKKYLFFLILFFSFFALAESAEAATHYASPEGSGDICSEAAPCSVDKAIAKLIAGDKLILKNGTYLNKMLSLDKAVHPGLSGEPEKPISIKAETDGQVIFDGQYWAIPCSIKGNVEQYIADVIVEGIVCRRSSRSVFNINYGQRIILKRVSMYDANILTNSKNDNEHILIVWNSRDCLVEDIISGGNGRDMFSVLGSNNIIIRRPVAFHNGYQGGGKHFNQMYCSGANILENAVMFNNSANRKAIYGAQYEDTYFDGGIGAWKHCYCPDSGLTNTIDNKFYGNIFADKFPAWAMFDAGHTHMPENSIFANNVVLDANYGIFSHFAKNAEIKQNTIFVRGGSTQYSGLAVSISNATGYTNDKKICTACNLSTNDLNCGRFAISNAGNNEAVDTSSQTCGANTLWNKNIPAGTTWNSCSSGTCSCPDGSAYCSLTGDFNGAVCSSGRIVEANSGCTICRDNDLLGSASVRNNILGKAAAGTVFDAKGMSLQDQNYDFLGGTTIDENTHNHNIFVNFANDKLFGTWRTNPTYSRLATVNGIYTEYVQAPFFDNGKYGKGAYLMRPRYFIDNTVIPSGDNRPIGAEVLYRYQNGSLTGDRLWPHPMEERFRNEIKKFYNENRSITYESIIIDGIDYGGGIWRTLNGVYENSDTTPPASPVNLTVQ